MITYQPGTTSDGVRYAGAIECFLTAGSFEYALPFASSMFAVGEAEVADRLDRQEMHFASCLSQQPAGTPLENCGFYQYECGVTETLHYAERLASAATSRASEARERSKLWNTNPGEAAEADRRLIERLRYEAGKRALSKLHLWDWKDLSPATAHAFALIEKRLEEWEEWEEWEDEAWLDEWAKDVARANGEEGAPPKTAAQEEWKEKLRAEATRADYFACVADVQRCHAQVLLARAVRAVATLPLTVR